MEMKATSGRAVTSSNNAIHAAGSSESLGRRRDFGGADSGDNPASPKCIAAVPSGHLSR
jgi:hypothetical protein